MTVNGVEQSLIAIKLNFRATKLHSVTKREGDHYNLRYV